MCLIEKVIHKENVVVMPVNSKIQVHTVFLDHIIPYIQVNNETNDSVL